MSRGLHVGVLSVGAGLVAMMAMREAHAQTFTYDPPGTLVPTTSGRGRVDNKVYAPNMRFPFEKPNAYANSQVYGRGGGSGPGGGQCDTPNYSYPWHDNYCESRSWTMPLCPAGTGHQGQDIRPPTCAKDLHWAVAAVDGTITNVGSYSVYLTAADGTRYDYLHMSQVQVKTGDKITRGQRMGKISNAFNGTPTTYHLHFNIRQNVANVGAVYVPPYTSLVESYKRLLNPDLPEPDAGPPPPPPPLDAGPDEPEPPPSPEDRIVDQAPPPADSGGCCATAPGQQRGPEAPLAYAIAALALAWWRRERSAKRGGAS
jgi:murein DD-endopeptidase MepM/ murein hydrolase activator NlpD